MTDHPFYEAAVKVLKERGDLYSFDDIVACIREGKMQSFANGESWVVTQVLKFPRRTILDIVLIVGDLKNVYAMTDTVNEFAKSVGATAMMSCGREGWTRENNGGWKVMGRMMIKELD